MNLLERKRSLRIAFLNWMNNPSNKNIKYIERFIKENKEVVPNEVEIIDSIQLIGEEKVAEVHIEEKEIEVSVDKKVEPNKIIKNDRFLIKGKVKEEYIQLKRKGLVENINKKIITKLENKIEKKDEKIPKKTHKRFSLAPIEDNKISLMQTKTFIIRKSQDENEKKQKKYKKSKCCSCF